MIGDSNGEWYRSIILHTVENKQHLNHILPSASGIIHYSYPGILPDPRLVFFSVSVLVCGNLTTCTFIWELSLFKFSINWNDKDLFKQSYLDPYLESAPGHTHWDPRQVSLIYYSPNSENTHLHQMLLQSVQHTTTFVLRPLSCQWGIFPSKFVINQITTNQLTKKRQF